jgi:hypothetical protein
VKALRLVLFLICGALTALAGVIGVVGAVGTAIAAASGDFGVHSWGLSLLLLPALPVAVLAGWAMRRLAPEQKRAEDQSV